MKQSLTSSQDQHRLHVHGNMCAPEALHGGSIYAWAQVFQGKVAQNMAENKAAHPHMTLQGVELPAAELVISALGVPPTAWVEQRYQC